MNKSDYHNPWNSTHAGASRSSAVKWGMRLSGMIRRAMACTVLHLRRAGGWWSSRLRFLWQATGFGSKLAAIGIFLAGLVAIVILGYLLIYLIPFLIMAIILTAICSFLAANLRMGRFR